MRHRFLNPTVKQSNGALDASFRFAEYLRECTSEQFRELVEVEPETWGIVMLLIVLSRLYMMIPHEETKLAMSPSLPPSLPPLAPLRLCASAPSARELSSHFLPSPPRSLLAHRSQRAQPR